MTDDQWQVQDAKQRFSELLRAAQAEGAQYVTRHGREVAVVIDIAHYRELTGTTVTLDFKEALTAPVTGPGTGDGAVAEEAGDELATVLEGVIAERGADVPRDVAFD